jgi:succinylglutamate desuccinylase
MPEAVLHVLDDLPAGFLDVSAPSLHRLLPQPTLIHLRGRHGSPLFVSILLHGNEDTGLRATQQVLAGFASRALPRSLSLFVGNVSAARAGLRHLDCQPDYNRVWPGTLEPNLPEAQLMRQVVDEMAKRAPFASIDIHNNTGMNPHYACVNNVAPATLQLAALFSRIVVYFTRPLGVQSMAMSRLCPAVTVECGKAGSTAGDLHAARLVNAALKLDHFPAQPPRREDIAIYHTVATVKIPPGLSFSFDDSEADLRLPSTLERWNFSDLPPGAVCGKLRAGAVRPEVHAEDGRQVFDEYFSVDDGLLRLRRATTPAMLTLDTRVVRQDCLCYLMDRYPDVRWAAPARAPQTDPSLPPL